VFLDRDGVINVRRDDHVKSVAEFELLPGAAEAVARLTQAGLSVIVISNQSVIGRGLASQETVEDIHRHMLAELARAGGHVTDVLYCPHAPADGCDCRKPSPRLLLEAAQRHHLALTRCIMIGDSPSDVEAAHAAGCQALLLGQGGAADLAAAVSRVLVRRPRGQAGGSR